MTIEVKALSGTIGAEVNGIDLAKDMGMETQETIKSLFLKHKVLFFTNQSEISKEKHIQFGKVFGELETEYPSFAANTKEYPEIVSFNSEVNSGRASIWHIDTSISKTPTLAGILYMEKVPDSGGDTMWADLEAAYASLSPAMQDFLADKTAVHDMFSKEYSERPGAFKVEGRSDIDFSNVSSAEHPVVRVHPETGRRCLFVSPFFTSHIVGLSSAESANILNFLYERMQDPAFIVRRHWSARDVALWDNRCTMHVAVDDYGTGKRLGHRVCVKGDVPFGPKDVVPPENVGSQAQPVSA